jgi:hypothetical protein
MAVFNGERYLREAVDSVLAQTFEDFELLVVDDGSTDSSRDLLASYRDPRVRRIENSRNLGLTPSLNIGLRAARGELVARMDADDVAEPQRLAVQVTAMAADPGLVLIGSSYRLINEFGAVTGLTSRDLDDFRIRWVSLFRTPLAHTTAIFRRSLVTSRGCYYDEHRPTAQDYGLWLRLLDHGRGRVLAEPLMRYRVHPQNVTHTRRDSQKANLHATAVDNLHHRWPGLAAARGNLELLLSLYHGQRQVAPADVPRLVRALEGVKREFARRWSLSPTQRRWLDRQAAGVLGETVLSRGKGSRDPAVIGSFAVHGLPYLGPLLARCWEEYRASRGHPLPCVERAGLAGRVSEPDGASGPV